MKKLIFFATILLASSLLGDRKVAAQTANQPGSGNALNFNGTSDYVDVGNLGGIGILNTDAFSFECWLRINNSNDPQGFVVSRYDGSPANAGGYGWFVDTNELGMGTITFALNNAQTLRYSATYTGTITGNWYHIAATYNGVSGNLYINGQSIATVSNPGGSMGNQPIVSIGRAANITGVGYTGQIDEVRIWNRALTQTEIQTNMCKKLPDNYGNGLVGYWRFDEGVDNTCTGGQDACDASGNGNNGTKY